MHRLLKKVFEWLGGSYILVGMLLFYGGSFYVYVWSVKIAWDSGGFLAAAATLSIPVIAQLYWAAKIWYYTETICNWYTFSVISCALAGILFLSGGFLSDSKSEKTGVISLLGLLVGATSFALIVWIGFIDNGSFSTNKLQPISLVSKIQAGKLKNYMVLTNSFQNAKEITVKLRELQMLGMAGNAVEKQRVLVAEVQKLIDETIDYAEKVDDLYLAEIDATFKEKYRNNFQAGLKRMKQGFDIKSQDVLQSGADQYDEFWFWFRDHGVKLVEKTRPN